MHISKKLLIDQAKMLVLALRDQLHENLVMSDKTVKVLRVLGKATTRYSRRYYA